MKKSPPTPDVNANAPRPRRVSSDDPEIPTMDMPPDAPADTATGFDRATAATDQEFRSGLLPGSDDTTARERIINPDDESDLDENADPEPDAEFRAGLESYDASEPGADLEPDVEFDPERDAEFDSDVEPAADEVIDPPVDMDPTLAAELRMEGQTFPQQDDPDQEGLLDEDSARPNEDHPGNPNHERTSDPENETLGAVKSPDKR